MLVVISLNRLNGLFYTAEDKIKHNIATICIH